MIIKIILILTILTAMGCQTVEMEPVLKTPVEPVLRQMQPGSGLATDGVLKKKTDTIKPTPFSEGEKAMAPAGCIIGRIQRDIDC